MLKKAVRRCHVSDALSAPGDMHAEAYKTQTVNSKLQSGLPSKLLLDTWMPFLNEHFFNCYLQCLDILIGCHTLVCCWRQ